eukprot:scaffold131920_cov72-Phaeocystis_antarctica.AAC.9
MRDCVTRPCTARACAQHYKSMHKYLDESPTQGVAWRVSRLKRSDGHGGEWLSCGRRARGGRSRGHSDGISVELHGARHARRVAEEQRRPVAQRGAAREVPQRERRAVARDSVQPRLVGERPAQLRLQIAQVCAHRHVVLVRPEQ